MNRRTGEQEKAKWQESTNALVPSARWRKYEHGAVFALPDVQYKRFHKCILDIYRVFCSKCHKPNEHNGDSYVDTVSMFTDDDAIFHYRFVNPLTILKMSKLMFCSRIAGKAPSLLVDVIAS